MEKRISTCFVVFGLLSGSVAMFGMDSQLAKSHEIPKDSVFQEHHLNFADIKKEIIEDIEKADKVVHSVIQKGVEVLKEEPQIIVAVLSALGVKQQEEQNIAQIADIVEKVDDTIYNLVQKLEEAQITKNDQNVEDALKK